MPDPDDHSGIVLRSGAHSFELRVLGYQFPEGGDSANWLRVRVRASFPRGAWTATHPSLQVFDLYRVAAWFEDVLGGAPSSKEIEMSEPNLGFVFVGKNEGFNTVRIWLSGELLPPDLFSSHWDDEHDIYADFELSELEMRAVAESFRAEAARFPQRAGG